MPTQAPRRPVARNEQHPANGAGPHFARRWCMAHRLLTVSLHAGDIIPRAVAPSASEALTQNMMQAPAIAGTVRCAAAGGKAHVMKCKA
jgi:hypothetical protein